MKRFNATAIQGVSAYQLSRTVARIRRFTGVEKAVLRALVDHYPNVWPNVETIADESGFSVASVRRALTVIATENWICPVSATKEHPKGRRGGKNQSEQYVINDRKILNTLVSQRIEEGLVSGKIPTMDTRSQGLGIGVENARRRHSGGVSNSITEEPNPLSGKHTHSRRAPNPLRVIEEVIREETKEEIKEEKREERDQKSPSAPAHTSQSKPSRSHSTGGQDIEALVQDIKKAALEASNGDAVFYGKNTKAIKQALIDNPNLDRESILSAVRSRVREMDDFRLKNCGSELAEMLVALIQYKDETRVAQEQRDAQADAILAEAIARGKAAEKERARERSETEESSRSPVGLFGEPISAEIVPV